MVWPHGQCRHLTQLAQDLSIHAMESLGNLPVSLIRGHHRSGLVLPAVGAWTMSVFGAPIHQLEFSDTSSTSQPTPWNSAQP